MEVKYNLQLFSIVALAQPHVLVYRYHFGIPGYCFVERGSSCLNLAAAAFLIAYDHRCGYVLISHES